MTTYFITSTDRRMNYRPILIEAESADEARRMFRVRYPERTIRQVTTAFRNDAGLQYSGNGRFVRSFSGIRLH